MKRLRTVSTRRLLVIVGAIVVLAITAGIAQGALSSSSPTPAAKPLDRAVLKAVNAPEVDGLTAECFRGSAAPQRSRVSRLC